MLALISPSFHEDLNAALSVWHGTTSKQGAMEVVEGKAAGVNCMASGLFVATSVLAIPMYIAAL